MGHGGARRGAVPVLLIGRALNDVSRADDSQGLAPALNVPAATDHHQLLPQRMGVPVAACPRFECHVGGTGARRRRGGEQGVNPDGAGEVLGRTLRRGSGPVAFEFHDYLPARAARCAG